MKKYFLLGIIIIIALINIYAYRGYILEPYDSEYARDVYDHSQWTLARSVRSISDSTLYQVAGYNLLKNWQFFSINPEVPPLAKYFIGASILFFNNPYIYSIIFYLLSLLFFSLVMSIFISNWKKRAIAVLLFTAEPLIFSHLGATMLDLPQLCAFLFHIIAVIKLTKSNNHIKTNILWLLIAGISLGAFISIKIGFFAGVLLLADSIILWYYNKKTWIVNIISCILIAFLTYTMAYLPYFLQGHSIKEFITSQKWMIKFYFNSSADPIFGMNIITMLTGWSKGWHENAAWERVAEWTIMWPLYFFSFLYSLYLFNKQKRFNYDLYLLIIIGSLLVLFAFITFFTRYLILVIPLCIIFFIKNIQIKKSPVWFIVGLIFSIQYVMCISPSPKLVKNEISRLWSIGAYQDLYSWFDAPSKQNINRSEFWRKMQLHDSANFISNRKIILNIPTVYPWMYKTMASLNITYTMPIGEIARNHKLQFTKENNIWKIKWSENYIPNFIYKPQIGKYGKLILDNNTIISMEGLRPFISIIPNKIKNEQTMQQQIYKLTGKKKFEQELIYKANAQPDIPSDIGFILENLHANIVNKYDLDEGILITQKKTRIYSDEVNKYGRIADVKYLIRKFAPEVEPIHGGKIISKKDNSIMLKKDKRDGIDKIIPESYFH